MFSSHHIVSYIIGYNILWIPHDHPPKHMGSRPPNLSVLTPMYYAFIHSDYFYSASSSLLLRNSEALPTQHGYCAGISRRSATVSEGLTLDPYVAARAGVEPMTLGTKGFDSTNAPHTPHN